MTVVLLVLIILGLAGAVLYLDRRLLGLERQLMKGPDLSGIEIRLEELFVKLQALPQMEQRLVIIDGGMKALPAALKAIAEKIDRMFQEFEEKTLPEEAREIGAPALSRIARARADMERQEEASLKAFNEASGNKLTPIVARGGL